MMDSGEEADRDTKILLGNSFGGEKIQDLRSPVDFLNPTSLVLGWSTVQDHQFQSDRSPVVFPPINHEGLFPYSRHDQDSNQYHHRRNQNQSPTPLSQQQPPSPPPLQSASSPCVYDLNEEVSVSLIRSRKKASWDVGHFARWFRLGIGILRYKVNRFASSLGNLFTGIERGFLWTFDSLSSFSLALATLFMLLIVYIRLRERRRRRWRKREQIMDHLLLLMKEKDEKIDQLLHQIAQMNKVLLALHTVPKSSPN